jgi:hypothetical protein
VRRWGLAVKVIKASALAEGSSRLAEPGRPELELTSDRMAAKCALFDATHTIAAIRGKAIEKMKFFWLNDQFDDL